MKDRELVEDEDYYYEGAYMVFTAKYLRDRGYCCRSGCRHCPYGFVREEWPGTSETKVGDGRDQK